MSLSRTLDSLESFINAQHDIIAGCRSDLIYLANLKQDALRDPQSFTEHLTDKLSPLALTSLEQVEPEYIDWKLFGRADPSLLRDIRIPSLHRQEQPWARSVSDLQRHLQAPLAEYKYEITRQLLDSDEESFQALSSSHMIMKKRKRDEAEDSDDNYAESPSRLKASDAGSRQRVVERELTPVAVPPAMVPSKGRKAKEHTSNFNQPWTLHEQHLLERFLLEIPDGEKHRWVKISEAMGGIRTPRQVASRVQKYNEKLKKFGLTS
ncbi:hypothetical protein DL93DRAFT_2128205 [Clavulina sp. PMI_390]|nr:hypothetical protein DL93DRAFT_2128205 [Clavulina sp. PMI_390]